MPSIKKLILRSIQHKSEERPTIQVNSLTISPVREIGINKRDTLYFRFKKILSHSKLNRVDFLDAIYKKLEGSKVQSHFHPTMVISATWWNMTHSHIYYYKEVYNVLKDIVMLEAFPVNRNPC